MEAIWRTRDRIEREVALVPARREHILQEHDELTDRLDEVRAAVEHPDVVTHDRKHPHRDFYRRTPSKPGWIKVVVGYRPVQPQGTWAGEVITAYPVKRPHPKEVPLWP